MTVRDWIIAREPNAPSALMTPILAALGDHASADASETPEQCLAAARRVLDGLVANRRFGRDSATDLLTVDALTTFAFDYASSFRDPTEVERLARQTANSMAARHGHHA